MDTEDLVHLQNGKLFNYFKKKDIMNFAGKWAESIILIDVTQSQTDMPVMYSLINDISQKTQDTHVTFHRPNEAKQEGRHNCEHFKLT